MTATVESPPSPAAGRDTGRIAAMTGGISAVPLFVLFGLNFVDEFDRVAFAALLPEIRRAFGLTDAGALTLGAVAGVFQLVAALPIGIIADRFSRVRLAIVAAALWGVCAVLTGVVPALVLLYIVRMGSGVGRIINEVVHPSLLGDYYPREAHPKVFGLHRAANSLGNIAGPLAGLIAVTFFWEAAFWILAIPTIVFVLLAVARLREPRRGESIDADLAAELEQQEAVPYTEARRQLFAVPTLRRLWLGAFLLGIGWVQVANVLSLYFENVFGSNAVTRGWVVFLLGAGTVTGLVIGSRLAGRATAAGNYARLATITGLSFVQFAAGLFLLSILPWETASLACAFFLSLGVGSFQPAYFSLVGLVAPPRVRSQAYAWAILILGLGGLTFLLLAGIGENGSYRTLVAVLGGLIALAGLCGATAARFVQRDVDQAAKSLETAARLRDELAGGGERSLLVCKGVEVSYGSVQILFGVDMEVKEGEIIALLGTNGAGKSTLLKAISGLVDPIGGAIYFGGRDITHADAVQTAKMGIVQVPGGKAVFPTLTVGEHFKAGTWLYANEDSADVQQRIDHVLDLFPRLRERWDQMAGNMSGGEQQQLALGMAFVAKPRLLVIDELSLGLAPTIVEQLLKIVRDIHSQGCTIILVEQSVNVALTIADRAYFMEKGEVRFEGPTAELLERGDILRSVFLEGAASGSRSGSGNGAGKPVPAGLVKSGDVNAPVLEVVGLTVRFGGITAVNDVSFDLMPGQILGLIGPNGAGKTTIFDLISGLTPLNAGRIWLRGVDVTDIGPDRRAALGLGRSFQDARIFPSLTVAENIAIGLERHIETRDHLAALLNLPAMQESEEDVAWTVEDLVELMGLGAFRDKFVSELSTGSRRIVDLAMAIAHDPAVLLLDEPSSGVAQKETEALGPLLKRIQRETGCALLLIEHDMPLITSVSDEIIALELGEVVVRDTPENVIRDPRVVSAYLGGDIDIINRSGTTGGGAETAANGGAKRTPRAGRRPVRSTRR